jgi:hypothetical protein
MTATLDTLTAQLKTLETQAQIAHLQKYVRAADTESRIVREAVGFGQIVPAHEYPQFERAGKFSRWSSQAEDRHGGSWKPHLETEFDLWAMQGAARWLAGQDETAIGVLENLTSYVIATGFDYQLQAKPRYEVSGEFLAAAQSVLDDWQEQELWRRVEAEAFQRAVRDGEFFLTVKPKRDGRLSPRFIEPEHVREPLDTRGAAEFIGHEETTDWSWGIASDFLDMQDVRAYYIDPTGTGESYDIKPAHQVEHCKLNVDAGIKRGISDFYAAFKEIEQASKLANNTAEGAAIQACIAYIRKAMKGTSAGAIESAQSSSSWYRPQVTDLEGTQRTMNYERFFPGRVVTTAGMDLMYGPMGTPAAAVFIQVLQMIMRRVGSRWSMPEYMVSGDASNANYASTLVAESPFVKSAERKQITFAEHYRSVIWRVLEMLPAMQRLLDHFGLSMQEFKRFVQLVVQPPRVSVRNRLEETNIRSVLHDKGVLSTRTWSGMEELDFEAEQKNRAEEPQSSTTVGTSPTVRQEGAPDVGPPVIESFGALVDGAKRYFSEAKR